MNATAIHPAELEERVIVALARLRWLKERINDWRTRAGNDNADARFRKAKYYHALALDIRREVEEAKQQAKEARLSTSTLAELDSAALELLAMTVASPEKLVEVNREFQSRPKFDLEGARRELSTGPR
jgi:hypothetical protein